MFPYEKLAFLGVPTRLLPGRANPPRAICSKMPSESSCGLPGPRYAEKNEIHFIATEHVHELYRNFDQETRRGLSPRQILLLMPSWANIRAPNLDQFFNPQYLREYGVCDRPQCLILRATILSFFRARKPLHLPVFFRSALIFRYRATFIFCFYAVTPFTAVHSCLGRFSRKSCFPRHATSSL